MKKIFLLLSLFGLASCGTTGETEVLDPVEVGSPAQPTSMALITLSDGCDYIQYKSTLYCGHQYTHHTYQAYFLTHSGKCKNHEINK